MIAMKFLFLTSFLLLVSCSGGAGLNLAQYPDPNATKDNFLYCHGYSCSKSIRLGFNNYEWKQISKIFKASAKDAKAERIQVGKAIMLMEDYAGQLAKTTNDLPKAPFRRQSFQELDCVDETINTTKYLKFLADDNLLKFHTVGSPKFRGLNHGKYPHNTATIVEIETGEPYVVDSYVYGHAINPDIRGLNSWYDYRVEELGKAENLNRL